MACCYSDCLAAAKGGITTDVLRHFRQAHHKEHPGLQHPAHLPGADPPLLVAGKVLQVGSIGTQRAVGDRGDEAGNTSSFLIEVEHDMVAVLQQCLYGHRNYARAEPVHGLCATLASVTWRLLLAKSSNSGICNSFFSSG